MNNAEKEVLRFFVNLLIYGAVILTILYLAFLSPITFWSIAFLPIVLRRFVNFFGFNKGSPNYLVATILTFAIMTPIVILVSGMVGYLSTFVNNTQIGRLLFAFSAAAIAVLGIWSVLIFTSIAGVEAGIKTWVPDSDWIFVETFNPDPWRGAVRSMPAIYPSKNTIAIAPFWLLPALLYAISRFLPHNVIGTIAFIYLYVLFSFFQGIITYYIFSALTEK